MHRATTFEHGGKVYEVRAIPTLNGWKVRIQSTAKSIKMLRSTECRKIWWPGRWKQRRVIFGAALPRNWWPPKRLPTTISQRKSINSNHEITPGALARSRSGQLTPRIPPDAQ